MRLYFAGASLQRNFIAHLATQAERLGHSITHRWWDNFVDHWTDLIRPNFTHKQAAQFDLQGVEVCEVLVAFLDDLFVSPGTHLEIGFALGLGKPVLAVLANHDKQVKESIWLHLPQVRLVSMEDLGADLSGLEDYLLLALLAAYRHKSHATA